jgi:hypothetical protein
MLKKLVGQLNLPCLPCGLNPQTLQRVGKPVPCVFLSRLVCRAFFFYYDSIVSEMDLLANFMIAVNPLLNTLIYIGFVQRYRAAILRMVRLGKKIGKFSGKFSGKI